MEPKHQDKGGKRILYSEYTKFRNLNNEQIFVCCTIVCGLFVNKYEIEPSIQTLVAVQSYKVTHIRIKWSEVKGGGHKTYYSPENLNSG